MSARQLRLLPPPKPLLDRLGDGFFDQLPQTAGVYKMSGADGKLLYVGQSKNLRRRLFSYKNACPETVSRKTIRLIHQVCRIVLEECASSCQARLRESELLRTHRPRFNVANVWPRANVFFDLECTGDRLTLQMNRDPVFAGKFGAFKSGCLPGYQALLRGIWISIHGLKPADFPRPLIQAKAPMSHTFVLENEELAEALAAEVAGFFSGQSDSLIQRATGSAGHDALPSFYRTWLKSDAELIRQFFSSGPERNFRLRQSYGIPSRPISQEELEDLLIRENYEEKSPLLHRLSGGPAALE